MASEKAQKTRQSILAASRAVILEEGIAALTMDRVAQQAGLSKGACMYHFKNKRALQAALIEETGYQAEQFALIHPGGAVGERLNHKAL